MPTGRYPIKDLLDKGELIFFAETPEAGYLFFNPTVGAIYSAGGFLIELRSISARIFECLITNVNHLVTQEEIIQSGWLDRAALLDYDMDKLIVEIVYIRDQLRKIDPDLADRLETRTGGGYLWNSDFTSESKTQVENGIFFAKTDNYGSLFFRSGGLISTESALLPARLSNLPGAILEYLIRHHDRTITDRELIEAVWGSDPQLVWVDKCGTLKVQIYDIRQFFRNIDPLLVDRLERVREVGYRWRLRDSWASLPNHDEHS